MIKPCSFVIISGLFSYSATAQHCENDIIGKWYTSEKESIVEIYKKEGKYFGKLVWIANPNDRNSCPARDENNPDKNLRHRTLLGLEFMYDLTFDGKNKWINGKVYNPRDGNTYNACMQLEDQNTLSLHGYIGFEWLGKSSVWTRLP